MERGEASVLFCAFADPYCIVLFIILFRNRDSASKTLLSQFTSLKFYRSLTMQHAVERGEQGHSNYAMCAVNPSRVCKTFDDAALCEIVNTISNGRDCLLEIVDFNVEVCRQFFILLRGY
jgi:hypothetical protein